MSTTVPSSRTSHPSQPLGLASEDPIVLPALRELPPAWLLLISLFPAPTSSCSTALHRPATLERPPCRTHSTLPHSHAAVPPQQPPRRAPRFLPRAHDAGALHPRPSLLPRRRRSFRVVSATSPAPPSDVGTSNIHRTDTCSQTRRRRAFPRSSSAWPPTDISGRHQPDGHPCGDGPTTRRYPASYWLRRFACADSALLSRRSCCPRSHDHTHKAERGISKDPLSNSSPWMPWIYLWAWSWRGHPSSKAQVRHPRSSNL